VHNFGNCKKNDGTQWQLVMNLAAKRGFNSTIDTDGTSPGDKAGTSTVLKCRHSRPLAHYVGKSWVCDF